MSGLALWDLAVKNPHKMLEKLKIAPPMSETITLAICREIVGKGCLSRMPAEVKELLLTVCFTRPQDAYIEKTVKLRGEDCTRMECPLMVTLKEA